MTELGDATSRVLRLPELLEHILSFLPFKDLLLVQGVNKAFRDVVSTSMKLQQKLHLIAMKDVEVQEIPMLPRGCATELRSGVARSWLFVHFHLRSAGGHSLMTQGYGDSWRSMFVTQPPAKTMAVRLSRVPKYMAFVGDDLISETGITLGQMIDHGFVEARKFPEMQGWASFHTELHEEDLLR